MATDLQFLASKKLIHELAHSKLKRKYGREHHHYQPNEVGEEGFSSKQVKR